MRIATSPFLQRSYFAMFSARPLVSTALLALVASTSANPFHFAIEEYRAPWNNGQCQALSILLKAPNQSQTEYSPEMVECDLKGVAFGSGYKPLVTFISQLGLGTY